MSKERSSQGSETLFQVLMSKERSSQGFYVSKRPVPIWDCQMRSGVLNFSVIWQFVYYVIKNQFEQCGPDTKKDHQVTEEIGT
jgi:hypothetical protein